jgi:hypothetical protein
MVGPTGSSGMAVAISSTDNNEEGNHEGKDEGQGRLG